MIRSVVVSPFQVNCWILVCPETGESAIIDCGDDAIDILHDLDEAAKILKKPLSVRWLLHTHAHLDHFAATRAVHEVLCSRQPIQPEIALHADDHELWQQLRSQGRYFSLDYEDPLPVGRFLKDGEELQIGRLKLRVLHTPGHSPGGLAFHLCAQASLGVEETLFSGDTLFEGSIGRTDLWGGDMDTLLQSIREKLFKLPDSIRVCCGHGPDTILGNEKRGNPFLQGHRSSPAP